MRIGIFLEKYGIMSSPHVICVSIPRSGHHFLENICEKYFGDELFYCFRADAGECCMQVPCARSASKLVIQKTHDWKLTFPTNQIPALYFIQYREPVGQILSHVEQIDKSNDREFRRKDRDFLEWWAVLQASKVIAFLTKWIRPNEPHRIAVEYNALVADPKNCILPIFEYFGKDLDAAKLENVLAAISDERAPGPGSRGPIERYKARDLTVSAILPKPLVRAYGDLVRARTPFVAWPEIGLDVEPSTTFAETFLAFESFTSMPVASEEVVAMASGSSNRYVRRELDRWKSRQ